ncbi:MAG: NAD(P)-dependent glycerol-3-phosphate dehydrogenase [Candidatus Sumerlaeota bacterium]|nr:NAD(P)-dependent glycerol-3-phosphate dehydrogenase [Candidatus Sumerlaeota bacterium]
MTQTFAVFSAGTWGVTLACLLRKKDYNVQIWEYDLRVVEHLCKTRVPAKLPHLKVPEDILITNNLDEALEGAFHWVIAAPSHGVRALAANLAKSYARQAPGSITVCTKGIEPDSGLTMTQVIASELGEGSSRLAVALSGPSHAEEVSSDMPTTIVAAAADPTLAERVQQLFNAPRFRVYTSPDILGVQLGGALKNVIAIAAGVCDGMGFGDNTRAALITRGLAEITRLGVCMGAQRETFAGLAGIGDLVVTATSHLSRNRNFGELLGQGVPAEEARARIGMEVEGIYAARSASQLAQRYRVELPISREVQAILYESKSPAAAVDDLLARDLKPEIY